MTYTNGASHNNVEQLLESIRSSLGESPARPTTGSYRGIPTRFDGAPQSSNAQGGNAPSGGIVMPNGVSYQPVGQPGASRSQAAAAVEDSAEFELPSIFKPNATSNGASAPRTKLLDRLSDALSHSHGGEPEADRNGHGDDRTVIRFEPAFSREQAADPARTAMPSQAPPAAAMPQAPAATASSSNSSNDDVKREMPTFFDTRMKKLGDRPAPPPASEPATQQTQPAQEPAVAAPNNSGPAMPPPVPQDVSPLLPMPPSNPAAGNGTLDDVAAQMMRPILRQWLSDNMPKIVEKALRSEAGGDAQANGQNTSAPGFPPSGKHDG